MRPCMMLAADRVDHYQEARQEAEEEAPTTSVGPGPAVGL